MVNGKFILRILNVRKGEEKLVSLLMAYSFFMGGATALFYTVVASSFLTSFDRDILPQVYIVGGILVYMMGMGVTRLQKQLPFDKLAERMLLFLIGSLTLFLTVYYITASRWVFFFLFIWNRVFVLVNGVTFWAVVAKLFNLQQSKRLSSLINTGEVISSVAMYLTIPLLVKLVSTETLLLVAVAFLLVCLFLLRNIHHNFVTSSWVEKEQTAEKEKSAISATADVVDPVYYRNIFLLALLPVFALFYVEYIFFAESRTVFPNKELLASFLGFFFGISAIIEMGVKTFLYNKLIAKYGIRAGILVLPLSLLFSFGVGTIYGLGYDTAAIFFACIALSRFFMSAVRKAISEPAYQVLYQPIPARFRLNVQGRIEGRAKSIGGLLAGVVLFCLVNIFNFNVLVLTVLFLIVTVIWILASLLGQSSYKKMVRERVFNFPLKAERNSSQAKGIVAGKSYEALVSQVFSESHHERIEAAIGLGPSNRFTSGKNLIPLLQDSHPEVREAAIYSAGELNRAELWPYLMEQLDFDRYTFAASEALKKAGPPLLKQVEKSFLSNGDSKAHQLKLLKIVEEIGGNEAVRFMRRNLDNPKRYIKDRVVEALCNLGYTCNSTEQSNLLNELDDYLRLFSWVLAAEYDLVGDYEWESQIMINLEREKRDIILKAFRVLELIYGSKFHVVTLLGNEERDVDVRDYLIEISDLLLPENIRNKILPFLDCDSLIEMRARYLEFFPQARLSVEERLMDIVNKDYTRISRWTKAVAIKELRHYPQESVTPILVANAVSSSKVISETAFYVLRIVNPARFQSLLKVVIRNNDQFHLKIMQPLEWLATEEDLLICKLRRLRSTQPFTALSNGSLQRILQNSIYFKAEAEDIIDLRKHISSSEMSLVVTYGSLFFSRIGSISAGEIWDVEEMKKAGAVMIPNVVEDTEFYLTENYVLRDLIIKQVATATEGVV
jgi:ATP:ADP antiporter, AAA family